MKKFSMLLSAFSLLFLVAQNLLAGTGKLTGKVLDAKTGEPVVGASVRLEGTTLGAAAGIDGSYVILNIPPGTYDVTVTAVGYTKLTVKGIIVSSDITTFQDFKLEEQAVGLPEVVVQAQRKLVDITQTTGRSVISADQISTLPVANLQEIMATSPSTFNGYVRGGKRFETSYIVDGIDLTDRAYEQANNANNLFVTYEGLNLTFRQNSNLVDLGTNSMQEVSVNSGASNARYVPSTAGVVDITLKQGRGPITGQAVVKYASQISAAGNNVYTGTLPDGTTPESKYLNEKASLIASGNTAKANRYSWTPSEYWYGNKPTTDAELSIGGGVTSNLGFMADVKFLNSYGRYPNEFNRSLNATATLDWSIEPTLKLTAVGILSDQGYFLGWRNSQYNELYKFYLQGVPRYALGTAAGSLKLVNSLSDKTYYEVQFAYTDSPTEVGYILNGGQVNPIGATTGDFMTFTPDQLKQYVSNIDLTKYFSLVAMNESGSQASFTPYGAGPYKVSRPNPYYENDYVKQYNLKGDVNSQVNIHHLLTAGFDIKLYDYSLLRKFSPSGVLETENYLVHPKQYGFYAQDRIEYSGVIVNAGLRIDGFDAGAKEIGNYFAPYTLVPDSEVLAGVNSNGTPEVVKFNKMVVNRNKNIPVRWLLEPMLGISHPISDRASMYYSFSRTMQPLPFSALYGISYSQFHSSLPNATLVDQDPMISTNYEMGLQYAASNYLGINISAYYRTIKNYNQTAYAVTPRAGIASTYYILFYSGYADSRGIELTLRSSSLPISDLLRLTGVLTYTYSYVHQLVAGTALRGQNNNSFFTLAGDSAKYGGGLPFGNMNNLAGYEMPVLGNNSSSFGGYDRPHRISLALYFDVPHPFATVPLTFRLSTFTTAQSGFRYPLVLADPRSRAVGTAPWDIRTDLRFEADISIYHKQIAPFIEVKNVFNRLNIIGYENSTIGQLLWEQKGIPTGALGTVVFQDGSSAYDIAREVFFGIAVNF